MHFYSHEHDKVQCWGMEEHGKSWDTFISSCKQGDPGLISCSNINRSFGTTIVDQKPRRLTVKLCYLYLSFPQN